MDKDTSKGGGGVTYSFLACPRKLYYHDLLWPAYHRGVFSVMMIITSQTAGGRKERRRDNGQKKGTGRERRR